MNNEPNRAKKKKEKRDKKRKRRECKKYHKQFKRCKKSFPIGAIVKWNTIKRLTSKEVGIETQFAIVINHELAQEDIFGGDMSRVVIQNKNGIIRARPNGFLGVGPLKLIQSNRSIK